MQKRSVFLLVILFLSLFLNDCIDPYNPKLDKFQSLLIVDGLLTDEESSCYVRLTLSTLTPDESPPKLTGALVSISDDLGNYTLLTEISEGIYKTDSTVFRGVAGREYTLDITTADGTEYQSEPCLLSEAPGIDSLYFGRDNKISEDGSIKEGITIFIDSKGPSENRYFRWSYEEWWKFTIPYPVGFKYVDEFHVYEIPKENVTCYKNRKSDKILIRIRDQEQNEGFTKNPVCFIGSEESNRLLIQYCIQVSQYAVSEKEYEFWRLMKEINESGGDIFDKQPFPVISNIHCVNRPDERVLGFFQVCGISKKKIYIKNSEIMALDLKPFEYPCHLVALGPGDFFASEHPITFDRIYNSYTSVDFNFIAPQYTYGNVLERLVFANKECSDCTITGTLAKPGFWVDLE